jgi:hypothetical protein
MAQSSDETQSITDLKKTSAVTFPKPEVGTRVIPAQFDALFGNVRSLPRGPKQVSRSRDVIKLLHAENGIAPYRKLRQSSSKQRPGKTRCGAWCSACNEYAQEVLTIRPKRKAPCQLYPAVVNDEPKYPNDPYLYWIWQEVDSNAPRFDYMDDDLRKQLEQERERLVSVNPIVQSVDQIQIHSKPKVTTGPHPNTQAPLRCSDAYIRIMRPDPAAALLAQSSGQLMNVVGNAIELDSHPDLTSHTPLTSKGWAPSDIKFSLPQTARRDFAETIRAVGGLMPEVANNWTKFGVAELPFITNDSYERPEYKFYRTDYRTQKTVYQQIEKDEALRKRLSSLEPSLNKVPNATGLQAVVALEEHQVLCMKRDRRTDAQANTWSISFEEQIKDVDFEAAKPSTAEFLFRRALVEEVIGGMAIATELVEDIWAKYQKRILAHRFLGTFYEEAAAHFQFLGFYYLLMKPDELAAIHRETKFIKGGRGVDPEGSFYVLNKDQQVSLLTSGVATVNSMYHGAPVQIEIGQLHRTSLYRLWRFATLMDYLK